MKVKELIELLSQMNPELLVVVKGYEGGVDEIDKFCLRILTSLPEIRSME